MVQIYRMKFPGKEWSINMKAIILAGGKGVRLYPISLGLPKPLVPIFDRPVMEHILNHLRKHGITEVCAAIQYMPDMITEYFEHNPPEGITLSFSTEDEPLGTAGCVKKCAEFIGQDDFIVISGDAVCDINLTEAAEFHRAVEADATILLHRSDEPLEYGLVMTSEDGRIERFIEKPSWRQVFCDTVNTGIYLFRAGILDSIPAEGMQDFGKDIFPALLDRGAKLYGYQTGGYWCDIGSPRAYMQCHFDLLSSRYGITPGVGNGGIYTGSPVPRDTVIRPPVYIGEGVVVESGCELGPNAVIGKSSRIGAGGVVRDSVINGATIGKGSVITGAVFCRGASTGRNCVVGEGCILGEGASVEDDSTVAPGVVIYPGCKTESGSTITRHVYSERTAKKTIFSENGRIMGKVCDLSPEFCVRLGAAIGRLGSTAIGYAGGNKVENIASVIGCGVRSAGANVFRHNARFAAEAAFAARYSSADTAVFVEELDGEVNLLVCMPNGARLPSAKERKVISELQSGTAISDVSCGEERQLWDICRAYEQELTKKAPSPMTVWVDSTDSAGTTLKNILRQSGYPFSRQSNGSLRLHLSPDGRVLTASDKDRKWYTVSRLGAMLTDIYLQKQSGTVCLPFGASRIAETIAEMRGITILRVPEDNPRVPVWFFDGIAAAVMLCNHLAESGLSLSALDENLPQIGRYSTEIRISGSRAAVMRKVSAMAPEAFGGDGLCFDYSWGGVRVRPCASRRAIQVLCESFSTEAAKDICGEIRKIIEKADKS